MNIHSNILVIFLRQNNEISDLLCLLLLSGLQKGDLSENIVKKLQKYNVNIDDVANLNIASACKNLSIINTPVEAYEARNDEKKITYNNTKALETNNDEREEIIKLEKQNINDYISEMLKLIPNSKNETIEDSRFIYKDKTKITPAVVHMSTDYTDIIKDKLDDTRKNNQIPNLESLIKLWKTYASDNANILEKQRNIISHVLTTSKPKQKENYFKTDLEGNDVGINKIIDSFLKTKNIQILNDSEKLGMGDIAKQISAIIANDPRSRSVNLNEFKKDSTKQNAKTDKAIYNNDAQYSGQPRRDMNDMSVLNRDVELNALEQKRTELKNNALNYINNMFRSDETTKVDTVTKTNDNFHDTKESKIENISQPTIFQAPINNLNIQAINDMYSKLGHIYNLDHTTSAPEDALKVIADKIRKLILDDLKRDIVTMTPIMSTTITTTVTTEKSTTAIEKQSETLIDVTDVLKKFMKLFQQLQNKEEKIITKLETKQRNENKYSVKTDLVRTPPTPYKPHPVLRYPPLFNNIHQYQDIPYENYHINNEAKHTNNNIFMTKTRSAPITIQTNSNEIKPLGVHLPKTNSLIHQNIIVTTRNPFFSLKVYRDDYSNNGPDRTHRASKEATKIDIDTDFERYRTKNRFYEDKKGYVKYEPAYNERDFNAKYEEKYRSGLRNYRTQNTDYERLGNDNVRGYHEKLERTDNIGRESSDYDNGCCKAKISSRQQVPLSDAKKHQDDARFRNFLRTQQKVNDMLEKILASRTKDEKAKSVETT